MATFSRLSCAVLLSTSLWTSVHGFNMASSSNLAVYWGQNSYGATHGSDTANWQQTLSYYCGSDSVIDTFPIAFVDAFFDAGGEPSLDLSNICSTSNDPLFSGTDLPNCSFLATGIETCQSQGRIVTISLGGGTGAVGFTSDSQAQTFATTIWDLFLGGSSPDRPFGSAVLDGVDLDIEGGSTTGYAAFVTQIRSLASGASKQYYITAAPQCPYPDAYIGAALNAADFDAVYVQFYNNYCELTEFSNPNDWNFASWDNWAKTVSPNPNVKVYIGAPASSTAANNGYVDAGTIATIISETKSQYSSFGGVMLWDASQAYANSRYDVSVKNALNGAAAAPPPSTTSTKTTTTVKTTTTTTSSHSSTSSSAPGSGSCAGVSAWSSAVAYVGGSEVTYSGSLWTAKWWTEDDAPGGAAGVWTDDGTCTNAAVVKGAAPASTTPTKSDSTTKSDSDAAQAAPKASSAPEAKATPSKNSRFFRF